MLGLLLALQLGGTELASGGIAPAAATAQARLAPRLRASIGLVFGWGFTDSAFGVGPGLDAELGVMLRDRISLVARVSGGTVGVVTSAAAGLAFELAAGERWLVGLGAAYGFIGFPPTFNDAPYKFVIQFPIKVAFCFTPRAAETVGRQGFSLFAEVAGGITLSGAAGMRPDPPSPSRKYAFSGVIGFGYAWW